MNIRSVEASCHKPPTRLHTYEGKAQSTPRRNNINTKTTWMDAATTGTRSKRYGHLCRKDERESRGKGRDESCNNTRRIHTARRIHAKTRWRETERFARS